MILQYVFLGYLTFIQYKDKVKNDKKNFLYLALQARKSRVRILKITFIYLSKYFEFSCWISSRLQERNFKNVSVIYYLIFTLCQNRLRKMFSFISTVKILHCSTLKYFLEKFNSWKKDEKIPKNIQKTKLRSSYTILQHRMTLKENEKYEFSQPFI